MNELLEYIMNLNKIAGFMRLGPVDAKYGHHLEICLFRNQTSVKNIWGAPYIICDMIKVCKIRMFESYKTFHNMVNDIQINTDLKVCHGDSPYYYDINHNTNVVEIINKETDEKRHYRLLLTPDQADTVRDVIYNGLLNNYDKEDMNEFIRLYKLLLEKVN